jgi:hypothetical protein
MTEEQRKDFEEAAKRYADEMIGEGSEGDMHWQAVNRDFLAGCEHAVPKWIDVNTELPAKGKKVLVFDGDGSVSIAARPMDWEFTAMKKVWEYLPDNCFDSADWHYPSTTITHWQPLPSKP